MRLDAPLPLREPHADDLPVAVTIRVRGRVQGVGFRPAVWREARALGIAGDVRNDSEGVLIRAAGPRGAIHTLIARLRKAPPPLARIDTIETEPSRGLPAGDFRICESTAAGARTEIAPDTALCADCTAEVLAAGARRAAYAFTNCTCCGPRLTIVTAIPYDRANTTMAPFAMCDACRAEYGDPADRRFHAEPIACPACGPRLQMLAFDAAPVSGDPLAAAIAVLRRGGILALKGLGGFQLACDAIDAEAVARLRRRKHRDGKPFALMARDLDIVRRYAHVSAAEAALLHAPENPIVLLARRDGETRARQIAPGIAPGLGTLGFMLPTTPVHLLLLRGFDTPLVMTSGNRSQAPQAIDNEIARARLGTIADAALLHDRAIANRVDDSVVRVMGGTPRLVRRARGYAPAPIRLPPGFEAAPDLLAMGGELKAAFCLVKDGAAVLSQHQGDLENAETFDDYRKALALYGALFDHAPRARAIDLHPDYLSAKLGRRLAQDDGLALIGVQHHHAHIASCLAENGHPLDAAPVLGIALDGLGWGPDGTFWGSEFLRADYRGFTRLAHLKAVAMPGGARAVREPWRNLYAHLRAAHESTEAFAALAGKPLAAIDRMVARAINAPPASSAGRLFDAVAAALGICTDCQSFEGEAAARLEVLAGGVDGTDGYPFALVRDGGPWVLDPAPLWRALARDLSVGTPAPRMAARFHAGLADAITATVRALAETVAFDTVALSGGCFQNRILFERLSAQLAQDGFRVLTQAQVPANDGGLALGQAAVAAARLIADAQGDA